MLTEMIAHVQQLASGSNGMVEVEYAVRIHAPAAEIWLKLNWRGMAKSMAAAIKKVNYSEQHGRPTRTFDFTEGSPVRERLETMCDIDKHYYYRVIDSGDLPWTDYLGQIKVVPAGPDNCAVKFQAQFTPVDASADECTQIYMQFVHAIIERLKAIADTAAA